MSKEIVFWSANRICYALLGFHSHEWTAMDTNCLFNVFVFSSAFLSFIHFIVNDFCSFSRICIRRHQVMKTSLTFNLNHQKKRVFLFLLLFFDQAVINDIKTSSVYQSLVRMLPSHDVQKNTWETQRIIIKQTEKLSQIKRPGELANFRHLSLKVDKWFK